MINAYNLRTLGDSEEMVLTICTLTFWVVQQDSKSTL